MHQDSLSSIRSRASIKWPSCVSPLKSSFEHSSSNLSQSAPWTFTFKFPLSEPPDLVRSKDRKRQSKRDGRAAKTLSKHSKDLSGRDEWSDISTTWTWTKICWSSVWVPKRVSRSWWWVKVVYRDGNMYVDRYRIDQFDDLDSTTRWESTSEFQWSLTLLLLQYDLSLSIKNMCICPPTMHTKPRYS